MVYAPATLLELRDTSASWRAGVPGCRVSVTLLDRVHLVVHGGDCVVIRHADPAAAQLLAVALEGEQRFGQLRARGLCDGARATHPALRVRRAAIAAEAVPWLCQGWRAPTADTPSEGCGWPVLHLLRASRRSSVRLRPASESRAVERDAWISWARQQRARGGALVILHDGVATDACETGSGSSGHLGGTSADRVREPWPHQPGVSFPFAAPTPTEFRLVSGRLVRGEALP